MTFVQVGNDNRLPFASKSFEIVLAAYVAHGMQPEQRLELYSEMKRLSRYLVILHEYNQNRSLLTNIVEYAEGGDYFNFIRIVEDELKGGFWKSSDRRAWRASKLLHLQRFLIQSSITINL